MPLGVSLGLASALLTALVTEVYAHRCLAHRAFRVSPALGSFLTMYFRVVVGTDPETWAAVHRIHHRYADTPRDPHSPRLRSPFQVLLGSAYLFAMAKRDVRKDRPKGVRTHVIRVALVGFYVVVFGAGTVLVMFLAHLVGYLGIMGMVNTVGHLYGRKPHPEAPGYDIGWLAIPLLGHGYHNSHHAHPAAARTGPLDPIWPLLRAGAAVGLVELDERLPAPCCGAPGALVTAGESG